METSRPLCRDENVLLFTQKQNGNLVYLHSYIAAAHGFCLRTGCSGGIFFDYFGDLEKIHPRLIFKIGIDTPSTIYRTL